MTSKEYIKGVLYNMEDLLKQAKTDNCKSVIIDCEDEIMHYNQIIKDLDELEELKKIMGTPIQDIMKRLKILEEMREYIKVIDYGEEFQNRYALQVGDVIYPIKKDVYDMWSRWLENEKNNR